MTPQEIFTTVLNHLHKQGKRAVTPRSLGAGCAYLDVTTGNRCAVGCLLTEDQAKEWDAKPGGINGIINHPEGLNHPPAPWMCNNLDLLDELQFLHDSSRSWKPKGGVSTEGRAFARRAAERYGLELPPEWAK